LDALRYHTDAIILRSFPCLACFSMATGTSRTQLSLLDENRSPLRRDGMSVDINRMVSGGRMFP
jgi:hypothetical protein